MQIDWDVLTIVWLVMYTNSNLARIYMNIISSRIQVYDRPEKVFVTSKKHKERSCWKRTCLCLIWCRWSWRKLHFTSFNDCIFTQNAFLALIMPKRASAKHHLVEQNTCRPNINLFPKIVKVSKFLQHLNWKLE